MSYSQSLSGGSTYRTVTDAQLVDRNDLLTDINNEITGIYADYNNVLLRFIENRHGYNFQTNDNGTIKQPDFTVVYLDSSKILANVKSDDKLLQSLRSKISSSSLVSMVSHAYLLSYLREHVPNANTLSDEELLSNAEYVSYRNSFSMNIDINTLTDIPNRSEFMVNPLRDEYLVEYNSISEWWLSECSRNICYGLLSKLPNGFTRTDVARSIHDYIHLCRDTSNPSVAYAVLKHHIPPMSFEIDLIRSINKSLIEILQSEIDFESLPSIQSHFKSTVERSPLYKTTKFYAAFNTISVLFPNLCIDLIKAQFAAYFQYIECDVYLFDIVDSQDPSLIKVLDDHTITSRISMTIRNDDGLSHGYSATYDDITNIFSVHITPESNLSYFIEYFYLLDHQYVVSTIFVGSDHTYTNVLGSVKLVSLLFALTNIRKHIQPQRVIEYISHCISLINPYISNQGINRLREIVSPLLTGAQRGRLPVKGVDFVTSNPLITLQPFAGGSPTLSNDVIVKIIVGVGLILLIVILVILFRTKKESYVAMMEEVVPTEEEDTNDDKPVHPKRYRVYDYVKGDVPCDGKHVKRGVDKQARKAVNQTSDTKSIVNSHAVVDPQAVVNSNSTTDMFAVH